MRPRSQSLLCRLQQASHDRATAAVWRLSTGGRELCPARRPASRVIADSSACNMIELLAAIIGGRARSTATALMAKFGSTQGIVSASVADIALRHRQRGRHARQGGAGTWLALHVHAAGEISDQQPGGRIPF